MDPLAPEVRARVISVLNRYVDASTRAQRRHFWFIPMDLLYVESMQREHLLRMQTSLRCYLYQPENTSLHHQFITHLEACEAASD